jgi:hypothetical protein
VGVVLLNIAILLAVLLVLLAVPITVAFKIDRIKEIKGQVDFHWLFGLVRFRVGIPGAAKPVPQRKQKPTKKTSERKPGYNASGVYTLLKQPAFCRRTIRFIKKVLRTTHARDIYLRLRIGLGDPADTGRLWALLGPIASIATNIRSAEVHIEPEFMDPVLEVESHGEFRLIPLQFIALATTFVVSPTTLRAWRTLRQSNL